MKKTKVSPAEAVKTTYPQLAEESQQLQQTVAALAQSISGIEASLRRIGLEVSAWHKIAGGESEESGYIWSRDIGYTRIDNRWHIALREWSREPNQPTDSNTYRFSEAPPWMCLEAAGKIPELLVELIDRTRDIRTKIVIKKAEVDELAAVLERLASEGMKSSR